MSAEEGLSWELIKNVADALDSYRVRALIDAKQEILEAGVYNESEYETILFKMFDEEQLKYSLLNYINNNEKLHFADIKKFTEKESIELYKALSFMELLEKEKLILVDKLYDKIEGDEKTPEKLIFKDLTIEATKEDISEIKSIYEPVRVIFDSNCCSGCGLCAAICPVNCLEIENGIGKFDEEKCIRCGLCYFVCPRSYLPIDILNMAQDNGEEIKDYGKIGPYLEAYSAKTKIKEISEVCQDGGISSTCLYYLLEQGKIDAALGAKMSETPWRPGAVVLKNKEEVIETAGTKYVNNPNLQALNDIEIRGKNLAVVGVPCQMQALLKSKIYDIGLPSLGNIEYRIGIFCMESFSYEGLLKICEILKTDVKDAKKMDINKGKFFVYTNKGEELAVPIKEISNLAREDCEVCFDLTSESADISVGSIGSTSGWNTVLIRTEKGKQLYEELLANDLIESKDIAGVKPGLPLLIRIANAKRNTCNKHITEKKEKNERAPSY